MSNNVFKIFFETFGSLDKLSNVRHRINDIKFNYSILNV